MNWTSDLKQAGHNRDTTCYPEYLCDDLPGGAPEGYRWFYDLEADRDAAFEVSLGRMFGPMRLELAAAKRKSGLEQHFTNITHLDGSARRPNPDGPIESTSTATLGSLATRSTTVNAYYDVVLSNAPLRPYLGAGVGVSFTKLSDLYYESRYTCKPGAQCSGNPSRYDVLQDVNLTDADLAWQIHTGVDYTLTDQLLAGFKLTYAQVGNLKDVNTYIKHNISNLTNTTVISGIDQVSVIAGIKYRFGG